MCGFNCVYHDLNVCYYGRPIKLRLLHFLQMLLILKMNKNVPLHPNSSYYQMCIFKRQKSDIIIINIIRKPKPVS